MFRFGGAAFLVGYGLVAARRALRPGALRPRPGGGHGPGGHPDHLPGAHLAQPPRLPGHRAPCRDDSLLVRRTRWEFAAGAGAASLLWFTALGFGARLLRPLFGRPRAWRVLDGVIAVVMLALGISLAVQGTRG